MRRFYVGGLFYDWGLEPPLRNIKKRVAHIVSRLDLFPVLDICCGSGVQCYLIQKNGKEVYGLDLDSKMIHYAASKYPLIPFLCADATKIPIRDSIVRGAILSYVLHDKFPETRIKILRDVRRILHPEGKIVFVDFESPWSRISQMAKLYISWIERIAGRDHFRNGRQFLQSGGLRTFIRRHGLEEIDRYNVELAHTSVVITRFV